jgi:hypothetical protein
MSAYIMSDFELYSIAATIYPDDNILSHALANKLKSINIRSVNYRYNDKTRVTKCKADNPAILPNDVFKQYIDCWEYQSCENQLDIDFHVMLGFLKGYIK